MKRKNIIVELGIFIVFCLSVGANAQPKFSTKSTNFNYFGLSLVQTDRGSGFGGYYEWSLNTSNRIGVQSNILIVRGSNDYPVYDYYTNQYYERWDKKRLTLVPVLIGYKRILFAEQIANNFRPFVDLSVGPVIAFDPPNIPDFVERWKRMKLAYTAGGRIGGGVDFMYGPSSIVSIYFGYEWIYFQKNIDKSEDSETSGMKNYNGLIVKIGFGKKH